MNTRELYKRLRSINKDFKFKRNTFDSLNRINIDILLNGVIMNMSIMNENFYNSNKEILDQLSNLRNELGEIVDTNTGYKINF